GALPLPISPFLWHHMTSPLPPLQAYTVELEAEVAQLKEENEQLRAPTPPGAYTVELEAEVAQLKEENEQLRAPTPPGAYTVELEAEVAQLKEKNEQLRAQPFPSPLPTPSGAYTVELEAEVAQLKEENEQLRSQLLQLQSHTHAHPSMPAAMPTSLSAAAQIAVPATAAAAAAAAAAAGTPLSLLPPAAAGPSNLPANPLSTASHLHTTSHPHTPLPGAAAAAAAGGKGGADSKALQRSRVVLAAGHFNGPVSQWHLHGLARPRLTAHKAGRAGLHVPLPPHRSRLPFPPHRTHLPLSPHLSHPPFPPHRIHLQNFFDTDRFPDPVSPHTALLLPAASIPAPSLATTGSCCACLPSPPLAALPAVLLSPRNAAPTVCPVSPPPLSVPPLCHFLSLQSLQAFAAAAPAGADWVARKGEEG
ncbi:unnamed protein product, partial [Closterium sp. Naga37s-1]